MEGIVIRSTGSWYEILTEDKKSYRCSLLGKFKIQNLKVTNPIAVGDQVSFVMEPTGDTGKIIKILPRKNYMLRKSVHKTNHAHMIAANIDQAIIIASLIFPETSLGFIDRFLVTAESFRIPCIIVYNKVDLLDQIQKEILADIQKMYEAIGYRFLSISAKEEIGTEELKGILLHKKTLISGHSGVGKSTLINHFIPDLNLKTSKVSSFANKGVHTTTFAEMFVYDQDTFIIDTPGIKELGLVAIEKEELSHFFPEMRALLGQCKFHDCTHTHEPGCVVRNAVEEGEIHSFRYYSYLSMLEGEDNRR